MMKYFSLLLCAFLTFSFVGAASIDDTQILDALDQKQQEEMLKNAQELNEKIGFTQVNSCASMESVFSDFLEMYKKYNPRTIVSNDCRNPQTMLACALDRGCPSVCMDEIAFDVSDNMMVMENAVVSSPTKSSERGEVEADGGEYSTTNLQKLGVDEPEILKSNGKYLFYYANDHYSSNKQYISIIKAPTTSDLSDAEVVKKITLPESLSNIQLFLQDDYLVILATRYTTSYDDVMGNARTVAIIYTISDVENLVLEKMVEVYGAFQDARIVDGQLYLVSNVNLNWYSIAYADQPIAFNDLLPQTTELSLKSSAIADAGKTVASYQKVKSGLPCNDIFYLFPSEETLKETHLTPNFTLISTISLKNLNTKLTQKLVFGSTQDFHMSTEALYLPSPIYFSTAKTCRGCRWPTYSAGQNTLIHKFSIGNQISYQDSLIVPGLPLSQYSMDEDNQGNFRILTKTWSPNLATQLFVFDQKFKLAGSLLNIEPGEEFKSSRYIGDKLYLVTFQQIDPLFVVDVADISKPKIIGELKIPGYSTYLHPYGTLKNNVQYLIGLGYSTQENQRGGVTNDKVKIDLYKIDYNAKETAQTKCSSLITKDVNPNATDLCVKSDAPCTRDQMAYESCVASVDTNNIAVSAVSSYEFTGGYSYSPSLDNPRMFVWNSSKNQLLLPIVIQKEQYSYDDLPLFLGLKELNINAEKGSITETQSQNYSSLLKNQKGYGYGYLFANARVGYLGNVNYFLLNEFAGFSNQTSSTTLGSL